MLGNVFLKSIRDQRRALLWWAIALAAYAVYISAFWPTIRQNAAQFDRVLQQLPESLKAFLGGVGELVTPTGYLQQQVFQLTGPILFVVFGIRLGARATAGEEGDGTLDLLLAHPVSRRRILMQKFLAMVGATALVGLVLWGGLTISAPLFQIDVSPVRLAEAVTSLVLLAVAFGALAMAVGSTTGSRGVALAVGGGVAFASYLVNALSALVTALEPAALFSPFHYYGANIPVRNGLDPGHVAVLVGLVAGLTGWALLAFDRRDIAV